MLTTPKNKQLRNRFDSSPSHGLSYSGHYLIVERDDFSTYLFFRWLFSRLSDKWYRTIGDRLFIPPVEEIHERDKIVYDNQLFSVIEYR